MRKCGIDFDGPQGDIGETPKVQSEMKKGLCFPKLPVSSPITISREVIGIWVTNESGQKI